MDLDAWYRTLLSPYAVVGAICLVVALSWGRPYVLSRSQKLSFPVVSVEDGGMTYRSAVEHGYATVRTLIHPSSLPLFTKPRVKSVPRPAVPPAIQNEKVGPAAAQVFR